MTGYTEDQIRTVLREMGLVPASYAEAFLAKLRKTDVQNPGKTDMHAIWADSDTVTVKELRDAEKRQSSQLYSVEHLLRYIAEHREPEYPPGTIWQDSGKPPVPWYRTGNGMWLRFGREGEFSHNYPVRPLKRMDVI